MSVAVIFKAPYKKGGGAGGNAGYISKRFGVDKSINNVVSINANYIATRPKVEKLGTHGLFSNYNNVISKKSTFRKTPKPLINNILSIDNSLLQSKLH